MSQMKQLLEYFPTEQRQMWSKAAEMEGIEEIRLRTGQPIILCKRGREYFLRQDGNLAYRTAEAYRITRNEIEAIYAAICHYSPYAYTEEIRQGFLTVSGGHRIGICGQVVVDEKKNLKTIKNISFMNIRIAHQIFGAADEILPFVYQRKQLQNTLILSPPGCGKTTMLRDLIRQVSNGNEYGCGQGVCVVDERSEIGGAWMGVPQNDLGIRTDVMDGCAKAAGMMLMLRTMAPKVLAVDEIGGEEDMEALAQASFCGSKILATAHGETLTDYQRRFAGKWRGLFSCVILLGKKNGRPCVREFFKEEKDDFTNHRSNDDRYWIYRDGIYAPMEIGKTDTKLVGYRGVYGSVDQ